MKKQVLMLGLVALYVFTVDASRIKTLSQSGAQEESKKQKTVEEPKKDKTLHVVTKPKKEKEVKQVKDVKEVKKLATEDKVSIKNSDRQARIEERRAIKAQKNNARKAKVAAVAQNLTEAVRCRDGLNPQIKSVKKEIHNELKATKKSESNANLVARKHYRAHKKEINTQLNDLRLEVRQARAEQREDDAHDLEMQIENLQGFGMTPEGEVNYQNIDDLRNQLKDLQKDHRGVIKEAKRLCQLDHIRYEPLHEVKVAKVKKTKEEKVAAKKVRKDAAKASKNKTKKEKFAKSAKGSMQKKEKIVKSSKKSIQPVKQLKAKKEKTSYTSTPKAAKVKKEKVVKPVKEKSKKEYAAYYQEEPSLINNDSQAAPLGRRARFSSAKEEDGALIHSQRASRNGKTQVQEKYAQPKESSKKEKVVVQKPAKKAKVKEQKVKKEKVTKSAKVPSQKKEKAAKSCKQSAKSVKKSKSKKEKVAKPIDAKIKIKELKAEIKDREEQVAGLKDVRRQADESEKAQISVTIDAMTAKIKDLEGQIKALK